jgi:hypothetical protein
LQPHEALIGTRVKVLETDRRAELRGMFGTIEHRFGHPEHVALDVRLDDGRLELSGPTGWRVRRNPTNFPNTTLSDIRRRWKLSG